MSPAAPVQRSLVSAVSFEGIGVHSGVPCRIRVAPAPPDAGIVFIRDGRVVRAAAAQVSATDRGIVLGAPPLVATVEHLLAAASGLGLSNLQVHVDGDELPALDGSARPYVEAFRRAGMIDQGVPWPPLALDAPLWVADGGASVLALPAGAFRVTYVVRLPARLGTPVADVTVTPEAFAEGVAPARTWGDPGELSALRARGLARGASMENALGVGPAGYTSALRLPDEPARHKLLDLIGDLSLLGRPLRAHVLAVAAGHRLHIRLVQAIANAVRIGSAREGEP